jgi:hypothetical protein
VKVLLLQPYLAPYRIGLFEAIRARPDIQLTLVYFARPERRRKWAMLNGDRFDSIRLRSLVVPRGYERNWILPNLPQLAAVLRRLRPDVVICAPNAEGKMVRLLKSVFDYRMVVWTEDTDVSCGGTAPGRTMRRWFYPGVNAFIVPGQESRSYLETSCRVPRSLIFMAPNSVDDAPYACTEEQVRARFARDEAAREVRSVRPDLDWELHLAGAGDLQPPPLPGIVARGHVDAADCAKLMKSSQIFVLPSRCDCNPLSAIEAAKAGNVLLISDGCGNHPELARGGAVVIARDSLPALVAGLTRLLSEPAPQLAERAVQTLRYAAAITHDTSAAVFHEALAAAMRPERAA